MKKTKAICLFVSVIYIVSMLLCPVYAQNEGVDYLSDPSVYNGTHSVDAALSVLGDRKITDNVKSAFVYETSTDTLMYSYNPDTKMYPSSLVKILTAYIALEKGDLSEVITVKAEVLDTVPIDAVSSELLPGEMISLENLLYCMMVDSANDAAAVIADHISGSQKAFVEEMNLYASEVGCTATNFVNVHGLHHEDQYTTARDMCRILSTAIKNESFVKIFSTVNYTVPATNLSAERIMTTGNYMMSKPDGMEIYYDSRVTGGRTGVAQDGGRCLAVCAKNDDMRLISIVMGSETVYADDGRGVLKFGSFKETSLLLDAGFTGFKPVQVLFESQVLTQRPVVNGLNNVYLGTDKSVYTVLPENITSADLFYRYEDAANQIASPVSVGQVVSYVQIWHGNICVAQSDLHALNDVKTVNDPIYSAPVSDNSVDWGIVCNVLIVVLVMAAIGLAVVLLVRRIKITKAKKRSIRYRRYRRRSR